MEKRIEISYLVVIFDLFSRYFFFFLTWIKIVIKKREEGKSDLYVQVFRRTMKF